MDKKPDEGPDPSSELGSILTLLRIAAGWNEDDLAEASGLRVQTIADCEQGLMLPGLNSIVRMLGTMGYPFGAVELARTCIEVLRLSRTRPWRTKSRD